MDRKLMILNMLKRSINPAETLTGPDSMRRLQALSAGKALLVATPSSHASGFHDLAMDYLTKGGNQANSFTTSSGEPTVSSVQAITKKMHETKPNWIIALGGGSVLDASKIAWACYENPALDFTSPPPLTIPLLRKLANFIAIPTTAGSGSESSQAAVLKNAADNSVTAYVSSEWLPDIVILDPKLTLHLPAKLTVETGMDALSHAVESNVSRLSSLYLKAVSGTAIRLILENLAIVYTSPDNLLARENMMNASYLAGLCQSTASTGLAHALTHAASATIDSLHGAGNALFLYPTMCFNKDHNNAIYETLAQYAGYQSEHLFASIEQLYEQISLPKKLTDISHAKVDKKTSCAIADKALTDICIRTNPYKPAQEELVSMLESML